MSWSCAETPGAHVDDEDHRVGLGHRLARLLGHLLDDAGRLLGLEAAGVDDDELALADAAVAVVAVARQAGEVGDDRVAALRHAVEQRRLADVGAADDGDDGFHGARSLDALIRAGRRTAPPLRVTTSIVPPDTHRRRRDRGCRRSVRRSCGSPLSRASQCTLPSTSPNTTACADDQRRAQAAVQQLLERPGDVAAVGAARR